MTLTKDQVTEFLADARSDSDLQAKTEELALKQGRRPPTMIEVVRGFSTVLDALIGNEATVLICEEAARVTNYIMEANDAEKTIDATPQQEETNANG